MKPRLRFDAGLWWCGLLRQDFYTWATCAPTPKEAFGLWVRCQG